MQGCAEMADRAGSDPEVEEAPSAEGRMERLRQYGGGLLHGLAIGTAFAVLVLWLSFAAHHWAGTDQPPSARVQAD